MKKIIILVIAFLAVISLAFAADLANYPGIFTSYGNFDAVIVVGNRAPASDAIAQSSLIQFFGSYLGKTLIGKAKLSSEISSLDQNIISIGNPCNNPVSAQIMGNPQPCDKGIEPGKAVIALYDYKGYSHLVVAGYSDKGTRDAVNGLVNNWKTFSGNKIIVEIDEPKAKLDEVKAPEKESEKSDDGPPISDIKDEKEKLISELNEKIARNSANSPVDANAKVNNSQENKKTPPGETPKQDTKEQQKEEGIIKKILAWFSSLFGGIE